MTRPDPDNKITLLERLELSKEVLEGVDGFIASQKRPMSRAEAVNLIVSMWLVTEKIEEVRASRRAL